MSGVSVCLLQIFPLRFVNLWTILELHTFLEWRVVLPESEPQLTSDVSDVFDVLNSFEVEGSFWDFDSDPRSSLGKITLSFEICLVICSGNWNWFFSSSLASILNSFISIMRCKLNRSTVLNSFEEWLSTCLNSSSLRSLVLCNQLKYGLCRNNLFLVSYPVKTANPKSNGSTNNTESSHFSSRHTLRNHISSY